MVATGAPPPMSLLRNERTKLFAGWLDRASTACFAVGVVAPVASYLYGATNIAPGALWVLSLVWLGAAAVLHLSAQLVLKALRE